MASSSTVDTVATALTTTTVSLNPMSGNPNEASARTAPVALFDWHDPLG